MQPAIREAVAAVVKGNAHDVGLTTRLALGEGQVGRVGLGHAVGGDDVREDLVGAVADDG